MVKRNIIKVPGKLSDINEKKVKLFHNFQNADKIRRNYESVGRNRRKALYRGLRSFLPQKC